MADVWLSGAQVAARLGIRPDSWRSLVSKGLAPAADDPGDVWAPPNRRTPRWREASIVAWLPTRRGPGRWAKGATAPRDGAA